jgi:DNA-binding SARP family transcriptional activator
LSIRVGQVPYRQPLAGPAREMLIYLLSHPDRRLRREALPEAIWGELRAPNRGSFNTTLWRLKKFLAGLDGPDLTCDAATIRLSLPANCSIDSRDLLSAVEDLHSHPDELPEALRIALNRLTAAWRGPFADGEASDWLLEERERMHDAHVRGLIALMRDAGLRGRYEAALDFCQRILSVDPFRENVHCEQLWLMVLTGQRARAIRTHQAFARRLKLDMDIEPMEETTALFDFIRHGLGQAAASAEPVGDYGDVLRHARQRRAATYAALCHGHLIPET